MSKLFACTFRLTEEEKKQISMKAIEQGISISKYVREKALEEDISNSDVKKALDLNTLYLMKAIKEKNKSIGKLLDFLYTLLEEDYGAELINEDKKKREDLPEFSLLGKLVEIILIRISLLESEKNNAEGQDVISREFAIKNLNDLVRTFKVFQNEVI